MPTVVPVHLVGSGRKAVVIFSAFLIVLAISETVFIFGTADSTEAQLAAPAVLFPPALALALLGFMFISKWIFRSDVRSPDVHN